MRKALLLLALGLSSITYAANTYKLSEQQIEQVFASGQEVTFEEMYAGDIAQLETNFNKAGGEVTLGGYLVRCFFCGGIALHRYYAGTNKGAMWALYCCVPIVGSVASLVDFFWVVFDDEALDKYKDNDKYLVWLD